MTEPRETSEQLHEQDELSYARDEPDVGPLEGTESGEALPITERREQDEVSYAEEEPDITSSPATEQAEQGDVSHARNKLDATLSSEVGASTEQREQDGTDGEQSAPAAESESEGEQRTTVINAAVGHLHATEVQAINSAFQKAEVETLNAQQSAVAILKARDANVTRSGVGLVMAQQRADISQGGAAIFAAGETLNVMQGGGSILAAGNNMKVAMGGGSILVAGNEIEVEKGGGGILIAGNEIEIEGGFAGIVISPNVELEDGAKVLLTTPQAAALGAAFGAVFALVSWLLRRRG